MAISNISYKKSGKQQLFTMMKERNYTAIFQKIPTDVHV